LHEGIVEIWRGINNFAWGIVDVAWGTDDIEKGIVVVEESPFDSAEGAEKPAEPTKNKGFAGLGFDGSPGVAGAALRLATNAREINGSVSLVHLPAPLGGRRRSRGMAGLAVRRPGRRLRDDL
jgi:hypothetical protein